MLPTELLSAPRPVAQKRGLQLRRSFGLVFALLLLVVTLSLISERFLTFQNIINIIRQASVNGIIAIGMTYVILTGGIDLSVGSILGLTAVIAATIIAWTGSSSMAIASAIGVGIGIGLFNGYLITKLALPPFIATLGSMVLVRGCALIVTQGKPISGFPDGFRFLGAGLLGTIPVPVYIVCALFIAAYIVLRFTTIGHTIYAIGTNSEAARYVGYALNRYLTLIYALCGALSALAGLLLIGRLNSAQPIIGEGYELDVIAAVVVGGSSLFGGTGGIGGTAMGVLIIAIIDNGLNILNVSSFYEQIVKGAVIAIALLLYGAINRRQRESA